MDTQKQTLIADLKQFMITELNLRKQPADIKDDAKLFGPQGLGIDSLDGLQLGLAAEQRYSIKIPIESDEGKGALASVSSLADYIIAHKK